MRSTVECHQHRDKFEGETCEQIFAIGPVYMMKNCGPNTDSCGTPNGRFTGDDRIPLMLTRCDLSIKYDRIHARADLNMPHVSDKQIILKLTPWL